MKRFIFFLLNVMLVLVLLIGCTKDIKDKDTSLIPTEDKDVIDVPDVPDVPTSFKEAISKLDLKTSKEWELNETIRLDWIKRWIEFTFKDVAIQDLMTKNTYNHHKDITYGLALRVEKMSVQFKTDKELQNIEKNENGAYIVQIYILAAYKTEDGVGIQYLLDIVNCENYETILDILEYGLTLLDDDNRFSENLDIKSMLESESIIPNNVKAIATDKIINGYELYSIYEEDDKLFALLTQEGKVFENGNLLVNLKLCQYDYDNNEFTEIFTVENLDSYYFSYRKGKGIECGNGTDKFLVDFKGNISTITEDENKYIYSPDEKYYAYAEDRNLIIKHAESNDTIIKLMAVTDENLPLRERYSYGTYKWLDNNNFIYVRGGWEWSAGFGIVNINTLENTVLEESFLKRIDKLEGKKLYVSYNSYDSNYPFSYGHYNLDETPYKYNDDFDVEKHPELYEDFINVSITRLLSYDSKFLYVFEEDGEKHEILVKEFSVQDKKFTKEIKIVENQSFSFDYISYIAVLLENKLIAFHNRNFLYIVDLQNN